MRILMINHEFPPVGGGGGLVTAFLAREYVRAGHDVLVLTSAYRDLPRFETRDGYQIERVPALRINPNVAEIHEMGSFVASASWVGLWRARSFKPDVAHVFFGIPSGPIAWLLRQLAGIPYVVFLGGRDVPRENPDPPYYSDLYKVLAPVLREIWRSAAAVVACSEGLRELALQTAPTQAFDVIPDGIDLDKFQPALRGDVSKVRILGIGRLIPRKGFDTLIRAAAALKEKSAAPFEVEIVGDGPERKALEALTEGFGLSKVVRFAGTVPYERLSERYANADIYALTSHAEGMPLVVLEAMATGLPIVATDVQGMDELVTDGVNGRRFRVDDANALAIHLAELVDDAGTRRAFGAASRERVEVYSWGNVAEAYLEVLSKATRR